MTSGPHLNELQMECILAGLPDELLEQHLSQCEQCREEVETLRRVFGDLKATLTATAQREWQSATLYERKRVPRWAWSGALALLVLGLLPLAPSVRHHHGKAPEVPQSPAVETVLSDDALLNGVQKDIATSVPEPLEPLAATTTPTNDDAGSGRKTP
jgi:predicted anti-sigma-YlaC factor YlaD